MEPDPINIVFDRSSTVNTTNCTSITIIEDQALEGTHAFTLHIVGISPPPAIIVGHLYATVYIHDNNSKCVCVCVQYMLSLEIANSSWIDRKGR